MFFFIAKLQLLSLEAMVLSCNVLVSEKLSNSSEGLAGSKIAKTFRATSINIADQRCLIRIRILLNHQFLAPMSSLV